MLGIKFVGPPASVLEAMGSKTAARETAVRIGVPVIPGSKGAVADAKEIKEFGVSYSRIVWNDSLDM
jgi:acetyl/propionyl-CoA carboxylase alpha subunit